MSNKLKSGFITPSLSTEINQRIGADAQSALDQLFNQYVQHRNDLLCSQPVQQQAIEAWLRASLSEEQISNPQRDRFSLSEKIESMIKARKRATTNQRLASPAAKAMTLRPFAGMTFNDGVQVDEDAKLQILVPPYVGKWTSISPPPSPGGNAINASVQDGSFGFLIGAADGSAAAGAGIWVQFIPDPPLPRAIQIRPYTPYSYQWDDHSDMGYTAHNDGGFGIYVLSWNREGADQRLEQDFRYSVWSDGTGWWDDHHNPSWGDFDYGHAFLYGHEAPYFEACANRIYRACIWCFGSCEASGGFFGKALSASDINAETGFVVVGEQ